MIPVQGLSSAGRGGQGLGPCRQSWLPRAYSQMVLGHEAGWGGQGCLPVHQGPEGQYAGSSLGLLQGLM